MSMRPLRRGDKVLRILGEGADGSLPGTTYTVASNQICAGVVKLQDLEEPTYSWEHDPVRLVLLDKSMKLTKREIMALATLVEDQRFLTIIEYVNKLVKKKR